MRCPECKGSGNVMSKVDAGFMDVCPTCNGAGEVEVSEERHDDPA